MSTLTLSLKKEWFNMTASGEKKEDYRDITPYWCKRLIWFHAGITKWELEKIIEDIDAARFRSDNPSYYNMVQEILKPYNAELAFYNRTTITLGYPKKDDLTRRKTYVNAGITVGFGRKEWGADTNKPQFIIKHGYEI